MRYSITRLVPSLSQSSERTLGTVMTDPLNGCGVDGTINDIVIDTLDRVASKEVN